MACHYEHERLHQPAKRKMELTVTLDRERNLVVRTTNTVARLNLEVYATFFNAFFETSSGSSLSSFLAVCSSAE